MIYGPRHDKIFGVLYQVVPKPACSATKTSYEIEISPEASLDMILYRTELQRCCSDCAEAQAGLCLCYSQTS